MVPFIIRAAKGPGQHIIPVAAFPATEKPSVVTGQAVFFK